jgi:hypothetical protein
MPVFYHSVATKWSSDAQPINGGKGAAYGKRTEVVIKNGKGYKLNARLDRRGKTRKQIKTPLSNSEMEAVLKGNFIPGFWSNCTHRDAPSAGCKTLRLRKRK